jgi:adenosylcobyric acid synthase
VLNNVPEGTAVAGYEIHLGETEYLAEAQPFATITRFGLPTPVTDGAVAGGGTVIGTYLHGLFDEDAFRHRFLQAARLHSGLDKASRLACVSAERGKRIDRLADHVRRALDMEFIHSLIRREARE